MEMTQNGWPLDAGQLCDFRDRDPQRIDRAVELKGGFDDAAARVRVARGAHFHLVGSGHGDFAYIMNAILTVAPNASSLVEFAFTPNGKMGWAGRKDHGTFADDPGRTAGRHTTRGTWHHVGRQDQR
jgi:hypothetical protein